MAEERVRIRRRAANARERRKVARATPAKAVSASPVKLFSDLEPLPPQTVAGSSGSTPTRHSMRSLQMAMTPSSVGPKRSKRKAKDGAAKA